MREARVRSDCGAISEIQLGRENKHRLNNILQPETTLELVPGTYHLQSNIRAGQTDAHVSLASRCTRDA